ncbi:hypothetical protein ACP2AV_04390 [Aliiroseovarius sp. PTFE2010]|uniref:hypothetical protein n=1 Tax=Aliiroseovarius sp. PTFE2010 TaxID=3417190 RepID=UPI003CF81C6F
MYTGSIPVLASIIFNVLRHPPSPSLAFLKQPLKLSRFGLASVHVIFRPLGALREFPLPDYFFGIATPEWPVTALTIS